METIIWILVIIVFAQLIMLGRGSKLIDTLNKNFSDLSEIVSKQNDILKSINNRIK